MQVVLYLFGFTLAIYAQALDCRMHMNIGGDLHLKTSSTALSADKELLNKIKHHYSEALRLCPQLCKQKPKLCNNIGDIYQRLGQTDQAVFYYKKALRYDPKLGDVLFELGVIYNQRQFYGQALDYFLKALDANPNDTEAQERIMALVKQKPCQARSAEPGQHLSKDQLYDSLICSKAYNLALKRLKIKKRVLIPTPLPLRNILFKVGRADLKPESHQQLKSLQAMLQEQKNMRLMIEGHTDRTPFYGRHQVSPQNFCSDNQCLSEYRAQAVRDYLTAGGIAPQRLRAIGYGASQPFSSLSNDQNRRVVLRLDGGN